MKLHSYCAILAVLALFIPKARATVYYVNQNSANPTPPYNSWSTAATKIQDAINASANGDEILVTNGVYAAGGLAMVPGLTNRVALNKPVTVQSVNGPWVTIIQGEGYLNHLAAVRCAWLTNGATLTGFTLEYGSTTNTGDSLALQSGGGVWCASTNAIVANCVIQENLAYNEGGGAYQGWLRNCLVDYNQSALFGGGGAAAATLTSCTVSFNYGYGVAMANCSDCILYSNVLSDYSSSGGSVFTFCCAVPKPTGVGNISGPAGLFADGIHPLLGTPLVGSGTNVVTGTDIFGRPWYNPPSIGCAEYLPGNLVARPLLQLTANPIGFIVSNTAAIGQSFPITSYAWMKDGMRLSDNGHFQFTQGTNLTAIGVSFADAGNYQLVVSNSSGMSTSTVAPLFIHCVVPVTVNPLPPYSTWAAAATNIQDAITMALPGDVVLVTNGLYARGGVSMDGVITNCVSVTPGLLVSSVNGPGVTVIQGARDPVSTNGLKAVRCAWMTNNTILEGFTLQGGATRSGSGAPSMNGGGVYCASTNVLVYNCIISNNYAANWGGGAYSPGDATDQASLSHCLLVGNHAFGSGKPAQGTANAGSGGGASGCNLVNCLITSNFADQTYGGGTYNCSATNCAFTLNSSYLDGGAAFQGTMVNCTFTENTSSGYSTAYGAAVYGATLVNCIVYGNFSRTSFSTNYASCTMSYCCVDPPSGAVDVVGNPLLLADGIHLGAGSPCLGAGRTAAVSGTDIDGQPWNTPPAVGCAEARSTILNVPQIQSSLLLTNGFQFQFPCQTNANYTVQYATNLAPTVVWNTLQNLYSSGGGMAQIMDATAPKGARFYRVLA